MIRLLLTCLLLTTCCPKPAPKNPQPKKNQIYLYARLHESQPKETAEAQYLKNLNDALATYQRTILVE